VLDPIKSTTALDAAAAATLGLVSASGLGIFLFLVAVLSGFKANDEDEATISCLLIGP
jgi:hypothetical protein